DPCSGAGSCPPDLICLDSGVCAAPPGAGSACIRGYCGVYAYCDGMGDCCDSTTGMCVPPVGDGEHCFGCVNCRGAGGGCQSPDSMCRPSGVCVPSFCSTLTRR